MNNKAGNTIAGRQTANDVIYTPGPVAQKLIDMCDIKEGDVVLDPSRGGGAFYDRFPETCKKEYCEITEGIDFFDLKYFDHNGCNKKFDCVIGNPPYSLWNKWIDKTTDITNKFGYVFGVFNLTPVRLERIRARGFALTKMHLCKVDWWFSPVFLCVFERPISGRRKKDCVSWNPARIYCDQCNTRCKIGRVFTKNKIKYKYGMNTCSVKEPDNFYKV